MQSMHVESSRVWVWQRWSHVDDIPHRRSAVEVRMKPIPEDGETDTFGRARPDVSHQNGLEMEGGAPLHQERGIPNGCLCREEDVDACDR